MRRVMAIITIITLCSGVAQAGQLDEYLSVDNYFASNRITANNYFDADKITDDMDDLSMSGDIYDFDVKSTKRAFFYSMILPGAGQYYAGSRIKPLYYLGAEALIWTGYFMFHGKGDDKKNEYRDYADVHYDWHSFMEWWDHQLSEAQQDSFSHRLPWDELNNEVIRNHEYYENIGKYDQFQIGWDDVESWQYPPPFGDEPAYSESRQTYLSMRKKSNDYYQNASTMLMLALGNRIVSAFEAALTAKKYNKGAKRFSFKLKTKDFGNGKIPVVTWNYEF
jgi:hypothetical protein